MSPFCHLPATQHSPWAGFPSGRQRAMPEGTGDGMAARGTPRGACHGPWSEKLLEGLAQVTSAGSVSRQVHLTVTQAQGTCLLWMCPQTVLSLKVTKSLLSGVPLSIVFLSLSLAYVSQARYRLSSGLHQMIC